jgi:hypothetical protein
MPASISFPHNSPGDPIAVISVMLRIMINPVTTVALVGGIFQFVEIGCKVVSKSVELYRSGGADKENVRVESAGADLVRVLKNPQTAPASGDASLDSLCATCQTTVTKPKKALDELKVDSREQTWKSLRKALLTVWSKDGIQELE